MPGKPQLWATGWPHLGSLARAAAAVLQRLPPSVKPQPSQTFHCSHTFLCNTWAQPKAQDEGKYTHHAHVRHPGVQLLKQKTVKGFRSDFDNPVLKSGLRVMFPFVFHFN